MSLVVTDGENMLLETIVVELAAENTYVLAAGAGEPAVIIDPGLNSFDRIEQILHEHHCMPQAVLLTHGHLDHTWEAARTADYYDIPTYIHREDRPQLSDPAAWLSPEFSMMLTDMTFQEPKQVIELEPQSQWALAGMDFEIKHVPGHTLGSLVYITQGKVFSGDTLFNQGIGRTDLRGGNHQQLVHKIRTQLLTLPDDYQVYPGHGQSTTIGREKLHNPFL